LNEGFPQDGARRMVHGDSSLRQWQVWPTHSWTHSQCRKAKSSEVIARATAFLEGLKAPPIQDMMAALIEAEPRLYLVKK
jgi:hypothetical protein